MGVECWHHPHIASVEQYLEMHGKKFDLVFLYRAPHAAKHLGSVRAFAPQAEVVLNTVDLHFVREERQAKVEGSKSRLKFAATLKEKELAVMRSTDATILLNKAEVELIADLAPSVKTFMLPLTQEVPGSRRAFHERKDLVFLGGFNHLPNVDAVKYFCTEIMPILRERLPGIRLLVVGSNPPAELSDYAGDDVEIVGFVSNLDTIFDSCRVSVAPLRFGAGMKGKIVTSLSYGVPCVTTTIGSEGMGLTDRANILLGDEAPSFADAVVEAYTSQSLWEHLSAAGVQFAHINFSPEVVERKIQEMLSGIGISSL
jgi:glycosyltransferase involved in cell wall biosynthesis